MQIHRICHRDIKAKNILVKINKKEQNNKFNFRIKIGDFGCGKLVGNE